MNPSELPGFLHKFAIKFDLITTIDSLFKLITHKQLYIFHVFIEHCVNIHSAEWEKYVNHWTIPLYKTHQYSWDIWSEPLS